MDKLIKSKQESFDAICYVIKALGLFFCFYPLYNVFFEFSPQDTMYILDMRSIITAVLLLLLVLGIWLVLQPTRTMKAWRKWLEISVFYGICLASIMASGGNNSNYKFLFIFMVVTYTVQYGMNYGLSISIAAAAISRMRRTDTDEVTICLFILVFSLLEFLVCHTRW